MTLAKEQKTIAWAAGIWMSFWLIFTFTRHANFHTQAWDMGIFDQLFWNTVNGNFMQGTLEEIPNHFGIHFSPTLLLLVPLYALIQSPYTLLFTQTIALAAGIFPLFSIASRRLPRPFPMVLSIGYLLSPALHWVATYDFHEIAFFIPLLLFAWDFMEKEKFIPASVFFTLAAGTKEDAVLAVMFAGIAGAFIWRKDNLKLRNFGIMLACISLAYFISVIKIFMPAFGGGLLRLDRYSNLGNSAGEIARNLLIDPLLIPTTILTAKKLSYIFWLLIPSAGAALFSTAGTLLILPGLAENILTNFPTQFSGNYQYDAILIPGIFIGAIFGIEKILNKFPDRKNVIGTGLIFTIVASYFLRSPVNPVFFPTEIFRTTEKTEAFSRIISGIPGNGSVSANTNLVPHLSSRSQIYVLGKEPTPTDFILADLADGFGFWSIKEYEDYLNALILSGQYESDMINDEYLILKRR